MARAPIGVDVGSTAVRAVELAQGRRGKLKVARVAEVPLPMGTIVGGECRDPDQLAESLQELWRTGRFKTKDVVLGIASQQTLIRQVDLPWEPPEMFRQVLPLRVAGDLPVDPTEMTLDYHPLGEHTTSANNRMQKALIVASMSVAIENVTGAFVNAGLTPIRADFSPFALIRAAVHTLGDPKNVPGEPAFDEDRTVEVIVDVGAQMTTVAIHDGGRPLFIRLFPAGGDAVTRAIADHLNLPHQDAETLKRHVGIAAVDGGNTARLGGMAAQSVPVAQQIVTVMASSLVQMVRESVEYFLAASPNVLGVSRVLLSGGGTLLSGYADRLAAELRAQVGLLAPMHAFGPAKPPQIRRMDPRMNIAFGLGTEVK